MKIPYGKQSISSEDIDSVVDVLKSDFLTQGPIVPEFESQLAQYCETPYALAVANATMGLHLACRAINIGKNDRVWTSPNSFVASANCALYCGAKIDFIDIDPNNYNLSVNALTKQLTIAKENNALPTAIIVVHFAGFSCDMDEIYNLSQQYDFKIIEDASHAIGSEYQGSKVGSCQFSDITVFSFHPVKIITAGEGGMILTKDKAIYQSLQLLRNGGITKEQSLMDGESHGGWYYQQIDLGYNYRMTDIHAALGLSQLNRLDKFIEKRQSIAEYYNQHLSRLPLQLPTIDSSRKSAWHLYVILIKTDKTKITRKHLYDTLHQKGIGVQVHYIPIYQQPYYQEMGFDPSDYPNCEQYYQTCLSLPIYVELTQQHQDSIINTLTEIFKEDL